MLLSTKNLKEDKDGKRIRGKRRRRIKHKEEKGWKKDQEAG